MKTFETMTELQVLLYAYSHILDEWLKAKDHLDQLPDNKFTKARFEKWDAKYNEIHARILELEQAEQLPVASAFSIIDKGV